jgi:hypothetical protein
MCPPCARLELIQSAPFGGNSSCRSAVRARFASAVRATGARRYGPASRGDPGALRFGGTGPLRAGDPGALRFGGTGPLRAGDPGALRLGGTGPLRAGDPGRAPPRRYGPASRGRSWRAPPRRYGPASRGRSWSRSAPAVRATGARRYGPASRGRSWSALRLGGTGLLALGGTDPLRAGNPGRAPLRRYGPASRGDPGALRLGGTGSSRGRF